MIWIDASFGIEWILGTERIAPIRLPKEPWHILPNQYAEILVYFARRRIPVDQTADLLGSIRWHLVSPHEVQMAANFYVAARHAPTCKASLADALLAAAAHVQGGTIVSFNADFQWLHCRQRGALWTPLPMSE